MSDKQETMAEYLARVQNYRKGIPPPYGKKIEGRFNLLIIKYMKIELKGGEK